MVNDEYVVFLNKSNVVLPGSPTGLALWVYGDGSGHFLNVWVQDTAGQVRQFTFGRVRHVGWQPMIAALDPTAPWPQAHISGPDSSQLVYPLTLDALVFDAVPHNAGPFSGAIYLNDMATVSAAASPLATQLPDSSPANSTPTAQAAGKH